MSDQTSNNDSTAVVSIFRDDNEVVLERMTDLGFSQRDVNLVGHQLYIYHKMAFYKTGRFDCDLLASLISKLGPSSEYAASLVEKLMDSRLIAEYQCYEECKPPCLSEYG